MAQQAIDDDPVLAAAARAPFVPHTEEEERLLAGVDDDAPGIPHEEFMRRVASIPRDDDDDE